jgi:hypothetical protein
LVIAFLLWSAASFVNGVALRVDGGEFATVEGPEHGQRPGRPAIDPMEVDVRRCW